MHGHVWKFEESRTQIDVREGWTTKLSGGLRTWTWENLPCVPPQFFFNLVQIVDKVSLTHLHRGCKVSVVRSFFELTFSSDLLTYATSWTEHQGLMRGAVDHCHGVNADNWRSQFYEHRPWKNVWLNEVHDTRLWLRWVLRSWARPNIVSFPQLLFFFHIAIGDLSDLQYPDSLRRRKESMNDRWLYNVF